MADAPAPSWKRSVAGILALLLLLALAALFVAGVAYLFRNIQKEVAAAIVAAVATVAISVVTLVLTRHYERRQEIERQVRDRRTPTYEQFIAFWFKLLFGSNLGQQVTEQERDCCTIW